MGEAPVLEPDLPRFEEALAAVARAAATHGKSAGILVGTLATGLKRIEQGFHLVAIGTDTGYLTAGAQAIVQGVRRANIGL
jgi:2-keto-3-deoxy-L-rhamnonate aldolase RhmA